MGSAGVWQLWAPALVFAHAFAAFWFARVFFLANPSWKWPWQVDVDEEEHGGHRPASLPCVVSISATTPVPPAHLEWRDLGCSYKTAAGPKVVLQGITGRADPGTLHALLGPSGAGKSTVIDMLSHRKSVGTLSGQVLINGSASRAQSMPTLSAYVPQEDNFMAQMTAAETLSFHAAMVLPISMTPADRQERVEAVLAVVGLAQSSSTMVGGHLPGGLALRGLSGGERKRLAIAVGLLSAPSIIFFDEPTSGLDSFAAVQVMRYIRHMADEGNRVVIASIHQPRGAIWNIFDAVTVLSCGLMLYSGLRDQVVPWFTQGLDLTYHNHLPPVTDPALPDPASDSSLFKFAYTPEEHGVASDWVIDLVSLDFNRGSTSSISEPECQGMHSLGQLQLAAHTFSAYQRDSSLWCGNSLHVTPGTAQPWHHLPKHVGHADPVVVAHAADISLSPTSPSPSPPPSHTASSPTHISRGSTGVTDSALEEPPQLTIKAVCTHSSSSSNTFGPQAECSKSSRARDRVAQTWQHFCALLWRETACITRNPADVAGRMLTFAWIAVFAGLVFNCIPQTFASTQLRLNVHFSNTAFFLLMPFVSMSLYTADRRQYLADASARLYHPATYYCAKVCGTLPFHTLAAVLFCLIVHGMAELRQGVVPVVQSTAITTLVSLIAVQILHAAATLAPNQDLAFMMAIAWSALNLLLSGFFIQYKQFAFSWLSHLRWVSAQGYAFEGLAHIELAGATFNCSQGVDDGQLQLLTAFLPNLPPTEAAAIKAVLQKPGSSCVASADAVLEYLGLHRGFNRTFTILCCYWLAAHVLTYILLVVVSRRERR